MEALREALEKTAVASQPSGVARRKSFSKRRESVPGGAGLGVLPRTVLKMTSNGPRHRGDGATVAGATVPGRRCRGDGAGATVPVLDKWGSGRDLRPKSPLIQHRHRFGFVTCVLGYGSPALDFT